MIFLKILTVVAICIIGVLILNSKKILSAYQLFQLEEYNLNSYLKWILENPTSFFGFRQLIDDKKTPIVYTDRMNRLITRTKKIIYVYIGVLSFLALINDFFLIIGIILALLGFVFSPFFVYLSGKIQQSEEKKINQGFYYDAQQKIKEYKAKGLNIVGITGSFGKTSTKFITSTILKEKYKVQDTPSSYNTPMGLSIVINNDLTPEKKIFIAEMGAYVPGEIKECTDLVMPDIGVLTSIGPMHLETFKSIDNVIRTKTELLDSLPDDGVAIINYDDKHLKAVADTYKNSLLKYGLVNIEELDIYATDIKTTREGSKFKLWIKDQSINCSTKMLGKHNISNILAGAAVGYSFGMTIEEIENGINKTEPVEHRLFLIPGANGTTIIDDAFNSNPAGAKAALEVINEFEDGRKIIVTPGMIGLGDLEEDANIQFGKEIAKVCDLAYLVGEKITEPIYKGLLDSGFDKDKIVIVNSLDEATRAFGPILRPGDVVLFENDLPDSYSEV